jgi:hypothetical protein
MYNVFALLGSLLLVGGSLYITQPFSAATIEQPEAVKETRFEKVTCYSFKNNLQCFSDDELFGDDK